MRTRDPAKRARRLAKLRLYVPNPLSNRDIQMNPVELIQLFETKFLVKYPYMRHFNIDAVITDVAISKGITIYPDHRLSLCSFMSGYLKEQTTRFQHDKENFFYVLANVTPPEKK